MTSITTTIQALLNHAESAAELGNTAEADTYRDKAVTLMARHAIDQATLDQAQPEQRRSITITVIDGADLPATYQTAHACGIGWLARTFGGETYMTHPRHSTKITSITIAIDAPDAFTRLALGLARIAATELALTPADRSWKANWTRGFWHGATLAAQAAIDATEQPAATSTALVSTRHAALAALTADGTILGRPKRTPPATAGWTDGRDAGRHAYTLFGHQITT
jgi:hypothetical protein